jgi:3-deoxy-D-manno-octulosonic-acid transferase
MNCEIARRTRDGRFGARDVLLLDTIGELGEIYAAADAAFVGGSLIKRGGHNVLEPALRGVPVVFGSHVQNFREAAALVQSARCGKLVENEAELVAVLTAWLENESERRAVAERAREALEPHRGAAARVANYVAQQLESVA